MLARRLLPLVVSLLLLGSAALAGPLLTRATVRRHRDGSFTVRVRGRLTEGKLRGEDLAILSGGAGPVRPVRFRVKSGRFRAKFRVAEPGGGPLVLSILGKGAGSFVLPIDFEGRVSRFRGAMAPIEPPAHPAPPTEPPAKVEEPAPPVLRPASELLSDPLGWPEREIAPENHVEIRLGLREGERGIDFELPDHEGTPHRLSDLLASKPVLLVLGSLTCPLYRAGVPDLNELAGTYGEKVHIVTVYVIEPHPATPDVSPYSGEVWPTEYSTVRQAKTEAERQESAATCRKLLAGPQLVLVDRLEPGGLVNPVWATYGPSPNATFVIGQDGRIRYAFHRTKAEFITPVLDAL